MIVQKAALVGGGVIGAGWAARFAQNGIDVAIFDPDPEAGRKVDTVMGLARAARERLGLPDKGGKVSFAGSVADAVQGADFVQESAPEREDLKRRLFAEIDAVAPPEVIVASSTSGLLPSRLQADMKHPERLVVGHPFNPVYLLPLVEICGGDRTSAGTKERAAAFYATLGMKPLMIRKEIDGFVADRLMEALWREALHLVNDGVATTEEIDAAISYGCGLRWSIFGTFLVYRIAGGEGGMRHFMAQFGPTLQLPWTKLMDVPELNDELLDKIAKQSDQQAAGRSIRDLERLRDECLVDILKVLKSHDHGAGALLP
ncbi:MAG: 3-hydroxyacyl-CoA dehydrogenase NAD-binding domain-containing protein [Geminicoccaceae bacterium]